MDNNQGPSTNPGFVGLEVAFHLGILVHLTGEGTRALGDSYDSFRSVFLKILSLLQRALHSLDLSITPLLF